MTTLRQGSEARTVSEVLLDGMVTAEIQNVLQDEVPKLAELLAKRVYEKVQKWTTTSTKRERSSSEEEDSSAKKGKIYHLTDTEEDIRETLKKKPKCFRCRKGDHSSSDCIFGSKMCYYCNRLGHSYDDCVERMVTKREVVQDPYFPDYDPWVFERIQYE